MPNESINAVTKKLKEITKSRGANYHHILTAFLIERAMERLVIYSDLSNNLIFKGGYVNLTIYKSNRYTLDLDALAYRKDLSTVIASAKEALNQDLNDHVWFIYEDTIDLTAQGEYGGTRLKYRFGLGEPPKDIRRAQIFHLDIGVGDPVTPNPIKNEMKPLLGGNPITWFIYPAETIVAEKLHPIVELGRGNSRSKDIYDLSYLLPSVDPGRLSLAIKETFSYRKTEVPTSISDFLENLDKTILKKGWTAATQTIKEQPDFDRCFGLIIDWFKSNIT